MPVPVTTGVFFPAPTRNDFLSANSSVGGGISQPPPPTAAMMTVPVPVFFVLVQRRPVSGPGGAVKD